MPSLYAIEIFEFPLVPLNLRIISSLPQPCMSCYGTLQLNGRGKDLLAPPKEQSIILLFPLYAIPGSFQSKIDDPKPCQNDTHR